MFEVIRALITAVVVVSIMGAVAVAIYALWIVLIPVVAIVFVALMVYHNRNEE